MVILYHTWRICRPQKTVQCHRICNRGIYMACIVLLIPCSRRHYNPLPNSTCGKLRHQNVMEKQETNPSLLKPYPALETLPSTITTELLLVRDFFVSSASFLHYPRGHSAWLFLVLLLPPESRDDLFQGNRILYLQIDGLYGFMDISLHKMAFLLGVIQVDSN